MTGLTGCCLMIVCGKLGFLGCCLMIVCGDFGDDSAESGCPGL